MDGKERFKIRCKTVCDHNRSSYGLFCGYIYFFLTSIFNKVYDTILEKDMEQIQWTSHYVTKLIYYEIEHRIEGLHACEESFHTYQEDYDTQTWTENLKDMKEKLDFERVGIVWVNGESVDDLGNVTTIQDPALFQAIHNDETYISNLSETLDNMLIAVPLHRNEQV